MTPRNENIRPPWLDSKSAVIIALVAALLGGTGGVAITPLMKESAGAAYITKADLGDALAPILSQLAAIQKDVMQLREEVAVARYAREHPAATRP